MLNAYQVKNSKPRDTSYKMADANGLYFYVAASGSKTWRYRYRINGRESTYVIGGFPAVSLEEARIARNNLKELVRNGINPANARKETLKNDVSVPKEQPQTFSLVAAAWAEKHIPTVSIQHGKRISSILEHVHRFIGDVSIHEITPKQILAVVSRLDKDGKIATAHKVLNVCQQVLEYSRITGLCQYNAASGLAKVLRPVESKHRSALVKPEEIGKLLNDLDTLAGHPSTIYFLKIMPYVFVRSSELRLARWQEFDFDNGLWRIPGSRMKMKRDELVPLSVQVFVYLQELKVKSRGSEFVFPGRKSPNQPISAYTALKALRRLGYEKDIMSVHGFRTVASSLLNEQAYHPDWIERQLAHREKNSARGAYNRAEYLLERRRMMQEWADYLGKLKKPSTNKARKPSEDGAFPDLFDELFGEET